ncbi:uncharacterized protein LOC131603122 [Vicia villosa]|uniref:uncharacterized protein LOC131603122 n=1 Tax=Vicia villosa TaxID=3911 RepID=UPI00273B6D7C|nr:uncharacterized protein LOC131603122 [Vicia villosa]
MLAVNPLMSVKEAGRWDGLVWIWEPSDWIKDFSDGETYLLDLLQQQLFHHKPLLAGADSFIWEDGNEGVFSVYSCVEEIRRRGEEVMQPASVLRRLDFMWKLKVPSKVSIFAWRFILDRLPTRDILQRRGILSGNNDSGCALCFSFLESSAHLFDQCFYSTKVWEKVGNWLGVLDRLNIEELKYFGDNFDKIRTGEERLMVGIVWMAVIWTLWTTRNAILFNGQVFNFDECFTAIVLACWKWFRVLNGSSKDCNFHYWNTLPPSCIKR